MNTENNIKDFLYSCLKKEQLNTLDIYFTDKTTTFKAPIIISDISKEINTIGTVKEALQVEITISAGFY